MMNQYPRHGARHLRQLNYLRKVCGRYEKIGTVSQEVLREIRKKYEALVRVLHRHVNPRRWVSAATCIIAFLQAENINAQHFLPGVTNPFGISGLPTIPLHSVLDLDNDGDVDLLTADYDGNDDFKLIFHENISSVPEEPAFAAGTELPLNYSFKNALNFVFTTGDLDQDGDFDVLMTPGYAEIEVGYSYRYEPIIVFVENIGTAESPAFQQIAIDTLNTSVFTDGIGFPNLADMDDDGDLDLYMDLLIYNFGSEINESHPVYYENIGTEGDWNFTTGALEPFNYQFPQGGQYMLHDFGDMDNDGDIDILAQSAVYDEALQGYVTGYVYYENAGDPANPFFAPPMSEPFNLPGDMLGDPCLPVLADWDQDGDQDLSCVLYGDYNSSLTFFENIGTSGVHDAWQILKVNAFPNPTSEELQIRFDEEKTGIAKIELYNIHGRQVHAQETADAMIQIPVKDWSAGSYILRITRGAETGTEIIEIVR